MADKFDVLTEQLAENTSVVNSAVTLINGLAERLDEAKNDPEQIAAIVSELKASNQSLAEAVAANTDSEGDDVEEA